MSPLMRTSRPVSCVAFRCWLNGSAADGFVVRSLATELGSRLSRHFRGGWPRHTHVRLAIASRRTQRHDDACAMPYAAAANLQERAYSPGPAWVRGRCGRLCSGRKTLFAYSTGDASSWIASNDFRGR
jgi:hypothetical protein